MLGDPPYRPVTQNVGAFAPEGAAEDLDMIGKLARGYIYTNKEKPQICAHNAEVGLPHGALTVTTADMAFQGRNRRRGARCCTDVVDTRVSVDRDNYPTNSAPFTLTLHQPSASSFYFCTCCHPYRALFAAIPCSSTPSAIYDRGCVGPQETEGP